MRFPQSRKLNVFRVVLSSSSQTILSLNARLWNAKAQPNVFKKYAHEIIVGHGGC